MERNWGCHMPRKVILKLAEEHVEFYEDFESLRFVCSHWRSAVKEANFVPPLLIIPDDSRDVELYKSFFSFSISKSNVLPFQLPEAENYNYSCSNLMTSVAGWMLLLAEEKENLQTHLVLFNPSSSHCTSSDSDSRGAVIQLPPVDLLSCDSRAPFQLKIFNKFVLSANPSTTSKFSVFLSLRMGWNESDTASVIWRNGDDCWTCVEEPTDYSPADVCYYSGAFYKIHRCGTLKKVEPNGHVQVICKLPSILDTVNFMYWVHYLVELNGQLVCLKRVRDWDLRFDLFRFDLTNDQFEEIQSLGDRAIFVDSNSCFSRFVDGVHFKANCIYFRDDAYSHFNSMCVYNLVNGEVQGFFNGPSLPYGRIMFCWVQCSMSLGNSFDDDDYFIVSTKLGGLLLLACNTRC